MYSSVQLGYRSMAERLSRWNKNKACRNNESGTGELPTQFPNKSELRENTKGQAVTDKQDETVRPRWHRLLQPESQRAGFQDLI